MRNLNELDAWRDRSQRVLELYGTAGDHTCGAFIVPLGSFAFYCIAASGDGWDHVSISLPNRCPSWIEMDRLKRLFFKDDETAMQLHVPVDDHINYHAYCLHLWRPQMVDIPLPPKTFVA